MAIRQSDFAELFKMYGARKHPLAYKSAYQLVAMVVLSAQTSDVVINKLAPDFFKKYPSLKSLAKAKSAELFPLIKSVRGFGKKADWLVRIAQALAKEKAIPLTVEELTELPGIGRKSANVIIREAGGEPQGIFVDLHVLRVATRLGLSKEEKPDKVEKALMDIVPREEWHAAGMSLSYLGRELCRPTDPACPNCPMRKVCAYYKSSK